MSARDLNKIAEDIGFLSSRQAHNVKSWKVNLISRERVKMKKYVLKEECSISNKSMEMVIPKGTEVIDDNNYIDEDGGVQAIVANGKHKGMKVIFNISELEKIV